MKSMKKLVLVGLVLLASVMVLMGCDTNAGGGVTANSETVTVTQENFADGLAQVQAKPGSTLVLGDNIFLSNSVELTGNFVLDLKGKTIEKEKGTVFELLADCSLTIKDSVGGGSIISGVTYGNCITNNGTLKLEGGTIRSGSTGVENTDSGTFTMNAGSINVDLHDGVSNSGTFMMNGGSINAKTNGVSNSGTSIISSGVIQAENYGVRNDGTLTVSGGSITATLAEKDNEKGAGVYNKKDFFLSGKPSITGTNSSFTLFAPISIVGALTTDDVYTVKWWEFNTDTEVMKGSNYTITNTDVEKFDLIVPSPNTYSLELKDNTLVLKQ